MQTGYQGVFPIQPGCCDDPGHRSETYPLLTHALMSLARVCSLTALVLFLSGCGENYPSDWPGISKPWFSNCPDLTGTYLVGRIEADRGYHVWLSGTPFMPDAGARGRGADWDVMSVSGDIDEALKLRFTRSPELIDALSRRKDVSSERSRKIFQARQTPENRWSESNRRLTDAQFAASLNLTPAKTEVLRTLRYSTDYACSGGWMTADDAWNSNPVTDDGEAHSISSLPTLRLGRDRSGGLIVHRTTVVDVEFSIWCGDHCQGFSLGKTTHHSWGRAIPIAASNESPATPAAPAWLGDFQASTQHALTPTGPAAARMDEAKKLLLPRIAKNVSLVDLEPAGSGVRAIFSARDTDTLTPLFDSLQHSDHGEPSIFYTMAVESLTHVSPTDVRLQLWMELPPAEMRLAREPLRVALLALLPKQVLVTYYGSGRGKYGVSIESPNRVHVSTLLRNIDASPLFQGADMVVTSESASKVAVDITFVDRE
ncbi:MAG: hypothetical protein ABI411_13715 [Tahibacter sp.]